MKRYVAAERIEWPVICTGDGGFPDALAKQYYVHGYPDVVLIDPAGKIAATHLAGLGDSQLMMTAVRDALEHVQEPKSSGTREQTEKPGR